MRDVGGRWGFVGVNSLSGIYSAPRRLLSGLDPTGSGVNASVTLGGGGRVQSAEAKGVKEQWQGMRKSVPLFIRLWHWPYRERHESSRVWAEPAELVSFF